MYSAIFSAKCQNLQLKSTVTSFGNNVSGKELRSTYHTDICLLYDQIMVNPVHPDQLHHTTSYTAILASSAIDTVDNYYYIYFLYENLFEAI